jgi:hypothetical protein
MIRKHFRLKRIALGLAFAAIAVPVAQAKPVSEIQGHGGTTPTMSQLEAQGNAYQTRVRSENTSRRPIASEISVQLTLSQAQVEALRYQAMVDLYSRQNPVRSENSFGAPGPSVGGAQGPSSTPTVSTVRSDRFDWSDAGIGGSIVFGAALMLLTAVGLGRRNRSRLASA